ncbi:MAG: PBPRA1643 family SWIM/SEC-C metal-binding motif protein [Spongiibacteraceae bacterium]
MSKQFFKGRVDKREDYGSYGYAPKRTIKFGSETAPLSLLVTSKERKAEVETTLAEHNLFANITVDAEAEENINELTTLLNTPKTIITEKTPSRNDPCSCGSGKKYKKCCG